MRWLEKAKRFWHETTAPPVFGLPSTSRRLVRMRMGPAVVLSLPALLLTGWYTWQTVIAHARTVSGTGDEQGLGPELFQLHLHDLLRRDYRRLFEGSGGPHGKLPTLSLRFQNSALDQLDSKLPPGDGETGYVKGNLEFRNTLYEIRGRYRGQKHWNWHYPQKSWKLRFEKPGRMLGHQTVLLLNSPEPEPLFEVTLLDLAREQKLLVPSSAPVRVLLNDHPMGLYFLEAPADEATLRANSRFPWNMYSGNGAPKNPQTGVSQLFEGAQFWNKSAGPAALEGDLTELERLLTVLRRGTPSEFATFANRYIDLDDYAKFDALDVTFGIDQHNYDENQKIYFDPYRGRFEPVVWNLRGADHEAVLERAASPLSLRLMELPDYAQRRHALVWKLANNEGSPPALEKRLLAWDERLGNVFEQDPFWDAASLLPNLGRYYSEMVRPMDRARQLEARKDILHRMTERNGYLKRELGIPHWKTDLFPTDNAGASAGADSTIQLDTVISGRAGLALGQLKIEPAAGCTPKGWRWRRVRPEPFGLDPWTELAGAEPAPIHDRLTPGTLRVPRSTHPSRGSVRLESDSRRYSYQISASGCEVKAVVLNGKNSVTQEAATQRVALAAPHSRAKLDPCIDTFESGPGGKSIHPWCAIKPTVPAVHFGPGSVVIDSTRVFDENTEVEVVPGTTFEMAPGASLVFRGKVTALGTPEAPIRWIGDHWGSIAVQGQAAHGSVFRNVEIRGGTHATWELTHFPAAFALHDTHDITLDSVLVEGAKGGEDGIHAAYVNGARFLNIELSSASADAIDLEFSKVKIDGLRVSGAKDEAVDLMGTELELNHLNVARCGGHGVSVGERSQVSLNDALVAHCVQGLLVKNSSSLTVHDVVVIDTQLGARIEQHNDWYEGESELLGDRLFFRSVRRSLDLKGKPRVDPIAGLANEPADLAEFLKIRGLKSLEELDRFPSTLAPTRQAIGGAQ